MAWSITRGPMVKSPCPSLRTDSPRRQLVGFGQAVSANCRVEQPGSLAELTEVLARARAEGLSVTFRGAGRSYGDAALNSRGLVVDTTALRRVLSWEPATGLLTAEVGLTIGDLWRETISDGYWPTVVPGTMHATLGGCVAMNVHGKNNYRVGPFGDHVEQIKLLTASGELLDCSRQNRPELFRAVVGGLGLLGAVVQVTLRLSRVHSGRLKVVTAAACNLEQTLATFESLAENNNYAVGWLDAFSRGKSLGRGELHAARYLQPQEEPSPASSLSLEGQSLPTRLFGLPTSKLSPVLRTLASAPGMPWINATKYWLARRADGNSYLQSHAAFAFLLDYVPDWNQAYGAGGLIQYQFFVPSQHAHECMKRVLETCQQAGEVANLAVLKKHRADDYLLSHSVNGWSLALDFPLRADNRERLWALSQQLTELVVAAGGRFYLAKDTLLRPIDLERAYGTECLTQFRNLKRQLDPSGLFSSDLFERLMP